MTLANVFGINVPTTSLAEDRLVEDRQIPKWSPPKKSTDFVGIEVEIETVGAVDNIRRLLMENKSPFAALWYCKADGSLRNMGAEFITLPIHSTSVERCLEWLFDYVRVLNRAADFSERCGIHFHFDMTRLDYEQIKTFIYIYTMYENEFFELAGGDRSENNFCVPLRKQSPWVWFPSVDSLERFHGTIPRPDYGKYSALNITRLTDIGTVEFRHFPGTWDINRLVSFVTCAQRIKDFVLKKDNIKLFEGFLSVANTESSWRQMTDTIFKDYSRVIWPDTRDPGHIEEGVAFVKKFHWLIQQDGVANIPPKLLDMMANPDFTSKMQQFVANQKNRKGRRITEDFDDRIEVQEREEERIVEEPPRAVPFPGGFNPAPAAAIRQWHALNPGLGEAVELGQLNAFVVQRNNGDNR